MNISEANAVNTVLSWLTAVSLVELDASLDPPGDTELVGAAGYLAGRARAALGAGPAADDVARQITLLLDDES